MFVKNAPQLNEADYSNESDHNTPYPISGMKTRTRIALNLLLPPGVAVSAILGISAFFSLELPNWGSFVSSIVGGYLVAAIPTIIHTTTMEYFYRRGLSPSDEKSIQISILSGTFSGILVFLIVSLSLGFHLFAFFVLLFSGGVTGAVTGLLIRSLFRRSNDSAPAIDTKHDRTESLPAMNNLSNQRK